MSNEKEIKIADKFIGNSHPTYFVADIAANHDSDLLRAKELIYRAAETGADPQLNFNILRQRQLLVRGIQKLGKQLSHQSDWKKSVLKFTRCKSKY